MHVLLVTCVTSIMSESETGEERACQDLVHRCMRFTKSDKYLGALERRFNLSHTQFAVVGRMCVELYAPLELQYVDAVEVRPIDVGVCSDDQLKGQ